MSLSWGEIFALASMPFLVAGTVASILTVYPRLNIQAKRDRTQSIDKRFIIRHLFSLITVSKEELENILGDIEEEYNLHSSKLHANLWLYKQLFKSVLPLLYKTIKNRLVSYLGEWSR